MPAIRASRSAWTVAGSSFGSCGIPTSTRKPYTEAGMGGMDLNPWLALASAHSAAIEIGAKRYPLRECFRKGLREFTARMRPAVAR